MLQQNALPCNDSETHMDSTSKVCEHVPDSMKQNTLAWFIYLQLVSKPNFRIPIKIRKQVIPNIFGALWQEFILDPSGKMEKFSEISRGSPNVSLVEQPDSARLPVPLVVWICLNRICCNSSNHQESLVPCINPLFWFGPNSPFWMVTHGTHGNLTVIEL